MLHIHYISVVLFLVVGGMAEQYSTMEITKFVHSSPDGHLGCFQFWVITNKAAICF